MNHKGFAHHTGRLKKGAYRMLEYLFTLQLFAEGAEGGDSGDGGNAEGVASGDEVSIPAQIPERAKDLYKKAAKATKAQKPTEDVQTPTEGKPKHIPYADLIKSDEYKEEHQAWADKTISDRLKKYKGVEEENERMRNMLSKIAPKYDLEADSDDFLDRLSQAVDDDDSYVESYAFEHDLSTEEAKKSLDMQRRLKQLEAEKQIKEQEAAQREQINLLLQSAERTKAVYPEFDLDVEMQNEKFRNLCAVTQGDTLAAYRAIHFDELSRKQGLATAQKAQQKIANSVAANQNRPIENGLSSQASAIVTTNYNGMNLQQIRDKAAEFRQHPERLK